MKTTDLYDNRVPTIKTQGRSFYVWTYTSLTGDAVPLRVDAGFGPEDPDHSRGYVRLELDRATRLWRGWLSEFYGPPQSGTGR